MPRSSLLQRLSFLRRPLGLLFLILAILGFILPVLPSWPFIVPAILLLGRRDRSLRQTHLLLRRSLRVLRRSRWYWVRAMGVAFSVRYASVRRSFNATLEVAERKLGLIN